MEYKLTIQELEDIVDEILDEDLIGSLDESMIETILFEELDEDVNESMSDAVHEFLDTFDRKASAALEQKIIEKISKKNGVSAEELVKVVGV